MKVKGKIMTARREIYEVMPDRNNGGWKVINSNRTCLKRTLTKREAVTAGQERARNRARDFGPSTLRIRDSFGRFQEERSYTHRTTSGLWS